MINTNEDKKKKAYVVYDCLYDEYGVPIVAHSAKEAKKIAFHSEELGDSEYINLRTLYMKDVDCSGCDVGIVEYMRALKLGILAFVDYEKCPICGTEDTRIYRADNGKIGCGSCLYEEEE